MGEIGGKIGFEFLKGLAIDDNIRLSTSGHTPKGRFSEQFYYVNLQGKLRSKSIFLSWNDTIIKKLINSPLNSLFDANNFGMTSNCKVDKMSIDFPEFSNILKHNIENFIRIQAEKCHTVPEFFLVQSAFENEGAVQALLCKEILNTFFPKATKFEIPIFNISKSEVSDIESLNQLYTIQNFKANFNAVFPLEIPLITNRIKEDFFQYNSNYEYEFKAISEILLMLTMPLRKKIEGYSNLNSISQKLIKNSSYNILSTNMYPLFNCERNGKEEEAQQMMYRAVLSTNFFERKILSSSISTENLIISQGSISSILQENMSDYFINMNKFKKNQVKSSIDFIVHSPSNCDKNERKILYISNSSSIIDLLEELIHKANLSCSPLNIELASFINQAAIIQQRKNCISTVGSIINEYRN